MWARPLIQEIFFRGSLILHHALPTYLCGFQDNLVAVYEVD